MITLITKDGLKHDNPKTLNVPKEKCKEIYKVMEG